MTTESAAARSAANVADALSRASLAARFREAVALCADTDAGLAAAAIEVNLRIDPSLVGDLHRVQQVLDTIAELIAAGDVFAVHMQAVAA